MLTRVIAKFSHLVKLAEHSKDIFQNRFGLANVLGAVEGTFVRIQNPDGIHAQKYYCRKNYYALNVMVVSDHHGIIMSICARWQGSTCDARVFTTSSLYQRLATGEINGILLGDKA